MGYSTIKSYFKLGLHKLNWSLVNLKYRWGVDLFHDIKKIFSKNQNLNVLDIGANEGMFAGEFLRIFPKSKLFAFEPGFSAFSILNNRFSKNTSVKCNKLAVGANSGACTLYTYDDSKKNTLIESMRDHLRMKEGIGEEVQVITVDDYLKQNNITEIDFMKIDVEGNELSVLKGATNFLSNGKIKLIFCEFHKILGNENNGSPHTDLSSMAQFLNNFNYRFVALYTQGVHRTESLVTCNVLFAHSCVLNKKINKS